MAPIRICRNPACGKSRGAPAILRDSDVDFDKVGGFPRGRLWRYTVAACRRLRLGKRIV